MSAHATSLATQIARSVERLRIPALVKREVEHQAKLEAAKVREREVERRVVERLRAEEMTTAEVCALLHWSRRTFERQRRTLPPARVMPGGTLRFIRVEIEEWRAARPTDPKTVTEGASPRA